MWFVWSHIFVGQNSIMTSNPLIFLLWRHEKRRPWLMTSYRKNTSFGTSFERNWGLDWSTYRLKITRATYYTTKSCLIRYLPTRDSKFLISFFFLNLRKPRARVFQFEKFKYVEWINVVSHSTVVESIYSDEIFFFLNYRDFHLSNTVKDLLSW